MTKLQAFFIGEEYSLKAQLFLILDGFQECQFVNLPPIFTLQIEDEGRIIGNGMAMNKAEAKEIAAREACVWLIQKHENKIKRQQELRLLMRPSSEVTQPKIHVEKPPIRKVLSQTEKLQDKEPKQLIVKLSTKPLRKQEESVPEKPQVEELKKIVVKRRPTKNSQNQVEPVKKLDN